MLVISLLEKLHGAFLGSILQKNTLQSHHSPLFYNHLFGIANMVQHQHGTEQEAGRIGQILTGAAWR